MRDSLANPVSRKIKLIGFLQIHPKIRASAKPLTETQGSICRDVAASGYNLG
jgi:hypothetical protein